jgi:hypothetical protein
MVTALCSLHKATLTVLFLLINLLLTVDTDASTLLTTKLATGHNPGDLILTFYYMQGKDKVASVLS